MDMQESKQELVRNDASSVAGQVDADDFWECIDEGMPVVPYGHCDGVAVHTAHYMGSGLGCMAAAVLRQPRSHEHQAGFRPGA